MLSYLDLGKASVAGLGLSVRSARSVRIVAVIGSFYDNSTTGTDY